jgi:integrase
MLGGITDPVGVRMLTDARIKAERLPKPGAQKKLADGDGLYLLIKQGATGAAYLWRLKYRIDGKESTLGFGPWPEVSIEVARERALEARRTVRSGQNPATVRREKREAAATDAANTFGGAARDYLHRDDRIKATKTRKKHEWLYQCLAKLHGKPLSSIKTADIVAECRRYEAKGQHETAHRVAAFAARVFKFANLSGYTTHNPARDLTGKDGALKPIVRESFAAIVDPEKFGALMRSIDSYPSATARHALQLLALTAVRGGELRQMEWSEVDLDKAEWDVPMKHTKMRKTHWVPLSRQAVAILKAQKEISGGTRYVFHQDRTDTRPMSDGTLGAALAALGYKPGGWLTIDAHHPHGFRSSFSTLMNAHGADPAIIELCLAHGKQDKVAAIYNRHPYQAERRALMQTWADYVEKLKAD